jgi:hypothetical protein
MLLVIQGSLIIICLSDIGLTFISDSFVPLIGIIFTTGLTGLIIKISYILLLLFGFYGMISLLLKNQTEYAFRKSKTDSPYEISALQINLSDATDVSDVFISISNKNPDVICCIQFINDWSRVLKQKLIQLYVYYSNPSVNNYDKVYSSIIPVIGNLELGTNISTGLIKNSDIIDIIPSYMHSLSNENGVKSAESKFKITVKHILSVQHSFLAPGRFIQIYWSTQIENFKLERIFRACRNTTLPQFAELKKENTFNNSHFTFDV